MMHGRTARSCYQGTAHSKVEKNNARGAFFIVKQGIIGKARNALVVVQTLPSPKLSDVRNYIIVIVKDSFLFVQYLQEVMYNLVQVDQNLSDVKKSTFQVLRKIRYIMTP